MTAYRFRLMYLAADGTSRTEMVTRSGRTVSAAFRKATEYATSGGPAFRATWHLRSVEVWDEE